MTLGGHSIPGFARKRALDGPTFYTPPGSASNGLLPYGCPPMAILVLGGAIAGILLSADKDKNVL